jgi:hypothetical protein
MEPSLFVSDSAFIATPDSSARVAAQRPTAISQHPGKIKEYGGPADARNGYIEALFLLDFKCLQRSD